MGPLSTIFLLIGGIVGAVADSRVGFAFIAASALLMLIGVR